MAIAAVLAGVYLIVEPRTIDLAAHVFRADLFEREGFTIWNGQWYAGHHTPAYSVLFPPLAAWLGPSLVGALSAVAGAALFEALARGHWGDRARWGSLWFAAGVTTNLWSGRLPFALGVTLALASLLLLQRNRRVPAGLVAALASLASPVAGFFLAIAGTSVELAERRRGGAWVAVGALIPPAFLTVAFPEGGWFPFHFSTFFPIVVFTVMALVLLPKSEKALRIGVALYGLGGVAFALVNTPMGANYVRLGALFGGPLLLCALAGRRLTGRAWMAIGLVLAGLAVWQWSSAVRDFKKAVEDPSVEPGYYEELRGFLDRHQHEPGRLEIPFTRSHWEAAEVAGTYPLARGWQRQLDIGRDRIFYNGALSDISYLAWLSELGVNWVALPSVKPDYSSYDERGLIERNPAYLKQIWRSKNWRVYEVMVPHPMVVSDRTSDIRMSRLGSDEFDLDVQQPGTAVVRVRWSPYWYAKNACVERAGDWTRVIPQYSGPLHVSMRFSPERDRGPWAPLWLICRPWPVAS